MDWTELANKHRRGDGLPKMIREPSPSEIGDKIVAEKMSVKQ